MSLLARDGTCLVTDSDYTSCTASHIVPYSRLDVCVSSAVFADLLQIYEDILRIGNLIPVFYASSGVLLRDDLHHAFDRLELSFYYKVRFNQRLRSTGSRTKLRVRLTSYTYISSSSTSLVRAVTTEKQSLLIASVARPSTAHTQNYCSGIMLSALRLTYAGFPLICEMNAVRSLGISVYRVQL